MGYDSYGGHEFHDGPASLEPQDLRQVHGSKCGHKSYNVHGLYYSLKVHNGYGSIREMLAIDSIHRLAYLHLNRWRTYILYEILGSAHFSKINVKLAHENLSD